MTELDIFLSKLIPALKKEIGSERAFELLNSICPPDRDSKEEICEIRERLSLAEHEVKKKFEPVSASKLLSQGRKFTVIPFSSLEMFYGTHSGPYPTYPRGPRHS